LEHRHHASTVDLVQGESGWDPEEFHYALQQWAGDMGENWHKYILTDPWIPIIHFFGLNDTGSLFAISQMRALAASATRSSGLNGFPAA